MSTAVADPIEFSGQAKRGLNRAITWSFVFHLGVVGFLVFAPREWLVRTKKAPTIMVINLSGSPGPRTGGFASLGGRPVEQVAPPPKRVEPVPPVPPKPDAAPASTIKPPKATPSKPDTTPTPAPVTRPPATGAQVTPGTAKAETGARGQSVGLAQGGGGDAPLLLDVPDFCCMDYIELMKAKIFGAWTQVPGQVGDTVIGFTIQRNGLITDIKVEKKSGTGLLDREAQAALLRTKELPPLPAAFKGDTLTVHLTFQNKGL